MSVVRFLIRCGGQEWEQDLMAAPDKGDSIVVPCPNGDLERLDVIHRTIFHTRASDAAAYGRAGILHCVVGDYISVERAQALDPLARS